RHFSSTIARNTSKPPRGSGSRPTYSGQKTRCPSCWAGWDMPADFRIFTQPKGMEVYDVQQNTPQIASLLMSEPFMLDPNFQRAVVLLCEHNEEDGTVGYVLNQPAAIRLSDVMSEFPDGDFPLF